MLPLQCCILCVGPQPGPPLCCRRCFSTNLILFSLLFRISSKYNEWAVLVLRSGEDEDNPGIYDREPKRWGQRRPFGEWGRNRNRNRNSRQKEKGRWIEQISIIKMAVLNLNLCIPPKRPIKWVPSRFSSPLHALGMPRPPRLPRVASPLTLTVRSSFDTASATVGQVTEVTKDTFWPIVRAAADKTVVLDMYTQWCGPCKVIAPKIQELSEKYLDVVFLKLDCNQENKPLAKELGIRVVPTFKILKDGEVVKEVTGAKFDDLVSAIESVRSS